MAGYDCYKKKKKAHAFLGGISAGKVFYNRESRVPWALCRSGCYIPFWAPPLKRGITNVKYMPGYKAQEGRQDRGALETCPPGEWAQELGMFKNNNQGNYDGSF